MKSCSRHQFLARAIDGDAEAFSQLIGEDVGSLSGLVRHEVADVSEWEDVFQETLVLAWRSIRQLKDVTRLRPWLLQIGRNHCRDYRKSKQRRQVPTDEIEMEEHLNRFGRCVSTRHEERHEVGDLLELLSAEARNLLDLFYLNGLTIAEIARRQRMPSGTVKRKLYEARGLAREMLK